jgi:hypothetical protein
MMTPVSSIRSRFCLTLVLLLMSFSAWAQNPAPPLPPPGSVPVTDSVNIPWGTYGLYKCETRGGAILCLFVLTRTAPGSKDLTATDNLAGNGPRLIDDLHEEHRLLRSYFINGGGQRQEAVNITRDDSIWFGLEFENRASNLITAARVVFSGFRPNLELYAPIVQSRGVIGGKP